MAKTTISIRDVPEALVAMRAEMAALLRDEAARQDDNIIGWSVARALVAVAAAFEAGVSRKDAA